MKKFYGFLGAVALLSLVSCSKDIDGSKGPESETKGDLFMTMNISPIGGTGTRTASPTDGKEIGKDRENTITNALVIFAEPNGTNDFKVVAKAYSGTTGTDFSFTGTPQSANYMTTFKVDRNTILKNIGGGSEPATTGEKTYYIFVLANANATLAAQFREGQSVQQPFATSRDENTYWNADNFLMSNADSSKVVIKAAEIQPGTFTTATNPFDLGTVKVQRAMSRFDLATGEAFTKFEANAGESSTSDVKNITVTFDAVALINMAQSAYSFKVTADSAQMNAVMGKILFNKETALNWVYSPVQTAFSTPLFSGAVSDAGIQTGSTVTGGLESFFVTQATEDEDANKKAVNRVGGYTLISDIAEDDNTYDRPTGSPSELPDYKIWRYCMENTNPNARANQKNGNSTGVVFRAEMTGTTATNGTITGKTALYAYNSVILGDAEDLRTYAIADTKDENDNTDVFNAVKLGYAAAVAKYNAAQDADNKKFTFEVDKTGEGDWSAPEGSELAKGYKDIRKVRASELAALDSYLVKEKFTIYRPNSAGKFYCYYIYWNRHNDNGNNSVMVPMEFATVRNNVYKLRVSKIHQLGHPGKPGDDPDDPKPDDPDEKDSFYCKIICEILPWEVRINDIEF